MYYFCTYSGYTFNECSYQNKTIELCIRLQVSFQAFIHVSPADVISLSLHSCKVELVTRHESDVTRIEISFGSTQGIKNIFVVRICSQVVYHFFEILDNLYQKV